MIVALVGTYLRLLFVYPLDVFIYENILHSHSHTALLGWIYNALFLAILYFYLPDKIGSTKYNLLFWLTQISIIGMLLTFAWQGYASFSIAFSTMHIFCTYAFIMFFLYDTKKLDQNSLPLKFITAGLFFLFLSSLGPWALVTVIMKGLAGTDLYSQVIYFYLHFQYNGWFIFSLIGLWLGFFHRRGAVFNPKHSANAFNTLFYSTIGTYALSLLGFKIPVFIWVIAFLSASAQLFGLRFLYILLFQNEAKVFFELPRLAQLLFRLCFFALLLKVIFQFLSVLPAVGSVAYINRDVAIGFIHLVMLGVVTIGLLGWYGGKGLINVNSILVKTGTLLFIAGLIFNELILFYPALVTWFGISPVTDSAYLLFILSLIMLSGTILLFSGNLKTKK